MYKLIYRVRISVSVSALIALTAGMVITVIAFTSVRKFESANRDSSCGNRQADVNAINAVAMSG